MQTVEVGQVWKDNDKRMFNRHLQVVRIDRDLAYCKRVIPRDNGAWMDSPIKALTRISLKRFKPTSSGYVLVWPNDEGSTN